MFLLADEEPHAQPARRSSRDYWSDFLFNWSVRSDDQATQTFETATEIKKKLVSLVLASLLLLILRNVINSFWTLSVFGPEVACISLLSSNSTWPPETEKILPSPLPWTLKHRYSRRRHGDSRSRRTVAGRTVNAWWFGKLFTACVISVAAWLRRDRFIVVFHVVEIKFFPLFVGDRFALATAEITTEETTATEVAAGYDAAEHEQRLFK